MPDQTADIHATLLTRPLNRWLVRLCAFFAAALCGWLVYQKYAGHIVSLAGCGQEGGCNQVLGGRWSQWMGIPVSLLAGTFYGGVFFLTFERVQRWFSIQADRLLVAAAVMAILCAFWFVGLLWFKEKVFCPYCALAHGLGIVFAIPLLRRAWKLRHRETTGLFVAAFSVALPAFLALMLGQLFGPRPDTHQIVDKPLNEPQTAVRPPAVAGNVQFFDGAFSYPVAELPRLGTDGAPHQLVEYFDYTCASCRDMSGDMEALFKAYPGKFSIILLPCPLNRQCNPYCGPQVTDHPGACELANFAMCVWRKAPAEFSAYHSFLMHLTVPVDVAAARAQAVKLCGGEEELKAAQADPWLQKRLTVTFEEYRLLAASNAIMPKLLLQGSRVMNGPARDKATFLQALQQEFKLGKPQP